MLIAVLGDRSRVARGMNLSIEALGDLREILLLEGYLDTVRIALSFLTKLLVLTVTYPSLSNSLISEVPRSII